MNPFSSFRRLKRAGRPSCCRIGCLFVCLAVAGAFSGGADSWWDASRVFPEWEVKPWGEVVVRPAAKGIVLAVSRKPGGVLFRKSLDARTPYRVTVHGHIQHLVPSVRIQLDDREFTYYSLDRGDLDVVLPPAKRLELLIYQDEAYAFDLQSIQAEPCQPCPSDGDLKTRIIREAQIEPSDSPLGVARKLRNWVADAVVLGGEPTEMERTTAAVVSLSASQTYVEIFEPGLGGVSCAGYAAFYQKVLRLFELPSFTIDIGFDNGTRLTHVTSVLILGGPVHRRFYIFDPTFSGEYVRDGLPVEALDLLEGEKADFLTAPMSRRVLIPQGRLPGFIKANEMARSHAVCDRPSSLPHMIECRGFMETPAFNAIVMGRAMAESGLSPGADFILGLMKHKILGIRPSDLDPNAHREFLSQAEHVGVPIPQAYRAS